MLVMQTQELGHRKGKPPLANRPAGVPLRLPRHPGYFLQRQCLDPMGLSQSEAARVLGVSRRRLHEIVQGQRSMTPDTAIRCALAFGIDADFWLALQAAWDNFHVWKVLRRQATAASVMAESTTGNARCSARSPLPGRFRDWH